MRLLDGCGSTACCRGERDGTEPVGRGAVAFTAGEPSAGGLTLSGCPTLEAAFDGTTDPQAVHGSAEVRDRHAVAARREAADRAGARVRGRSHDDLPLARADAGG